MAYVSIQNPGLPELESVRRLREAKKEGPDGTICFDFDGVLANAHRSGWEPLQPGIEELKRFQKEGYSICILTARTPDEHAKVAAWLRSNKIPFDKVTNVKPPAKFYIDDKAVHWPRNKGSKGK